MANKRKTESCKSRLRRIAPNVAAEFENILSQEKSRFAAQRRNYESDPMAGSFTRTMTIEKVIEFMEGMGYEITLDLKK